MAKPLLTEELWSRIEPLLPAKKPSPKGGRPPTLGKNRAHRCAASHTTGARLPWMANGYRAFTPRQSTATDAMVVTDPIVTTEPHGG